MGVVLIHMATEHTDDQLLPAFLCAGSAGGAPADDIVVVVFAPRRGYGALADTQQLVKQLHPQLREREWVRPATLYLYAWVVHDLRSTRVICLVETTEAATLHRDVIVHTHLANAVVANALVAAGRPGRRQQMLTISPGQFTPGGGDGAPSCLGSLEGEFGVARLASFFAM